jgi:hypothetical protein
VGDFAPTLPSPTCREDTPTGRIVAPLRHEGKRQSIRLEAQIAGKREDFTTFPKLVHNSFTGLWHSSARWKEGEQHSEVERCKR